MCGINNYYAFIVDIYICFGIHNRTICTDWTFLKERKRRWICIKEKEKIDTIPITKLKELFNCKLCERFHNNGNCRYINNISDILLIAIAENYDNKNNKLKINTNNLVNKLKMVIELLKIADIYKMVKEIYGKNIITTNWNKEEEIRNQWRYGYERTYLKN